MLKFLQTKSSTLSENVFSEKFTGKKILVIGAGPSTDMVHWENIEYDSVVTTTHFYLNDKIRNLSNITHVTLSEIIDFMDERLHYFLEKNGECTISLEPKYGRPFYYSETFKNFEEKYRDRLVYYNTEIDQKEGAAGRLAFFVMSFDPKYLYYVGIDGKSKNFENDPPGSFRKIQGDVDGYLHEEFLNSHIQMARSLHEYSKLNGCKLYNLGEGFKFNCSSEYSTLHFPLSEEIKQKIRKEN